MTAWSRLCLVYPCVDRQRTRHVTIATVGNALETVSESIRRRGGLALLVGSVLLLVSLLLPWAVAGGYGNGFEYLPAVAVLWAIVGLWGLGLALSLARVEEPPGLAALALLASVGLIADLLVTLNAAGSTVVAVLGGGPSLALIGLVAILVGVWQAERESRPEPRQPPEE